MCHHETSGNLPVAPKGESYKGTETSCASLDRFVASVVKLPALYANESLGIS